VVILAVVLEVLVVVLRLTTAQVQEFLDKVMQDLLVVAILFKAVQAVVLGALAQDQMVV
jgi:hypothetical protein